MDNNPMTPLKVKNLLTTIGALSEITSYAYSQFSKTFTPEQAFALTNELYLTILPKPAHSAGGD